MSWRARIGIIYPENSTSDEDYHRLVPSGVTVHIARSRAPMTGDRVRDALSHLQNGYIETAANLLTVIRPDSVAYACSSGSFIGGVGHGEKVISVIEKVTGSPATTASTASVKGLRMLGVKRVAVVSPYPEARNKILRKFIEDSGFEAVNFQRFQFPEDGRACLEALGLGLDAHMGPEVSYRLGKMADTTDTEAILIACTSFRTAEMIQVLEDDLGKPVVTANQAVMWDALRLAGVKARIDGFGRLYQL